MGRVQIGDAALTLYVKVHRDELSQATVSWHVHQQDHARALGSEVLHCRCLPSHREYYSGTSPCTDIAKSGLRRWTKGLGMLAFPHRRPRKEELQRGRVESIQVSKFVFLGAESLWLRHVRDQRRATDLLPPL